MAVEIVILKDIQLSDRGHVFTKKCSSIEYDAKRPTPKKLHQLVYQQGSQYGTVGDCCEYLSHAELMRLAAAGYVDIRSGRKLRRRKPDLAEVLYEAFRQAAPDRPNGLWRRMSLAPWVELLPEERVQWGSVADAAQEWARENMVWEE